MDVVYMVRIGDRNEELRHSLRTLANLPHDRVWVAGYRPWWLSPEVEHIHVPQLAPKHGNTWAIWQAIAREPRISDQFILFNDDFFVMKPHDSVTPLHGGPLDRWINMRGRPGSTMRRMEATRKALIAAGHDPAELLSWELHVPMVIDRAALVAMVEYAVWWWTRKTSGEAYPPCKRSLYGNLARATGTETTDVKIRHNDVPLPAEWALASTSDSSFGYGAIGRAIKAAFPEPGPYERGVYPRSGVDLVRAADML